MKNSTRYTTEEWLKVIGENMKARRLSIKPRSLTQEEVADTAQVSRNALIRLEEGSGCSLSTFVSVLRALNDEDKLHVLVPAPEFSPLDLLEGPKTRKRATRRKANKSES
ncbi:MAG: helix-turn-helix transcriptional regulator [Moraxellaceae bacterium]|nr:helix-turn-helix transcriptional regulator [Moraxellaceae bacterium]